MPAIEMEAGQAKTDPQTGQPSPMLVFFSLPFRRNDPRYLAHGRYAGHRFGRYRHDRPVPSRITS